MMTTLKNRHNHKDDFDLYGDVEKIKAALVEATQDVKGKAAEILSDSYNDMAEKTHALKENVSEFTAERPFKSLGIALLVGMAVGYLLRK
jgi:ElaB/YqjD/DUF883 family membrane-anchored ribosome-binding protein